MFKRLTAILLLVALVTANFTYYLVYAGFELNKKYIATQLCENRNKPLLHCNGHCYFMKKIKQASDKEKSAERQSQKNLFQEVFFANAAAPKFHTQLLRTVITPYLSSEQSVSPGSIYQPPRVV
jgi:hypothetical protein